KVALVEGRLLGGDCLNVGCVPSKCIIRSSRAAADVRSASKFGVRVGGEAEVDFSAVMERMRRIRAQISEHDSARRFQELGIDVFFGEARFAGPEAVEVGTKTLRFTKAVITTGARPVLPQVEGLAEAGFLTNETVFSLTERPGHIVFIGGGPLGCELAQAFCRLGCDVTIIERGGQFLYREDSDASAILAKALERDGVNVLLGVSLEKVTVAGNKKTVHIRQAGKEEAIEADEIFVATGRAPVVGGLNLEAAGVVYDDRKGVMVNDKLQTSNKRIYAAGDVCSRFKFTHTADAMARIVIQNTLFGGRKKVSALTIPWCTYTDPEVAHVGMYEKDAEEKGIAVDTFLVPMGEVDRALCDGEQEGFVKIHTRKGSDKIVGATIVARHAGEMISEISVAIVGNVGLGTISAVIHPYPTQAEAIRRAGDTYNRTRLTPFVKKLFTRWLAWRR
ncbi:MAG: mercuric reductase, partial [Phycisphaerae bacterium]|nr:mercuric reductase [Phycisphaerae bacterium]